MMIKRIEPKDYAYVLKLNEEYVDVLIPMDREELSFLEKRAAIFPTLLLVRYSQRALTKTLTHCSYVRWTSVRKLLYR